MRNSPITRHFALNNNAIYLIQQQIDFGCAIVHRCFDARDCNRDLQCIQCSTKPANRRSKSFHEASVQYLLAKETMQLYP